MAHAIAIPRLKAGRAPRTLYSAEISDRGSSVEGALYVRVPTPRIMSYTRSSERSFAHAGRSSDQRLIVRRARGVCRDVSRQPRASGAGGVPDGSDGQQPIRLLPL